MEKLFGLPQALRQRGLCPFDVRSRTRMRPIQEKHTRPHIDRALVVTLEIMIESREQELFDLYVPLGGGLLLGGALVFVKRIEHEV